MTSPHANPSPSPFFHRWAGLPMQAGLGFKAQHFEAILADASPPAFVEVHAENYMGDGGLPHAQLRALRERMPISVHGVGLSIGAASAPDEAHLDRLAVLLARHEPASFSEHLAWSTHDGRFYNDLLPLSYDGPTLQRVCAHIDRVQSRLGRQMLLENPSSYFEFPTSTWSEAAFLAELVARTGCGLLLDINNVYVSCANHGHEPRAYLDALPMQAVGEVHLAGHARDIDTWGRTLLIDNHGARVCDGVWALYADALSRTGPVATLIEWDSDVPAYETLRDEAKQAQTQLELAAALAAARDAEPEGEPA
ncbi:MAG: DUF692 domain-containing protein [Arenimonas sp.]